MVIRSAELPERRLSGGTAETRLQWAEVWMEGEKVEKQETPPGSGL